MEKTTDGLFTPKVSWKGAEGSGAPALSRAYPAYVKYVLCLSPVWPISSHYSPVNSCLSSTSVLWDGGPRLRGHMCIRKRSVKS